MIVFSLPKNKLWNGTGFIIKPSSIELSSLCFAEQSINIGSGKYKIKIIGSSLSGNGIFLAQIMFGDREISSKTILLNSRSNTETSFDIELFGPGPYTIKLSRGRESIGRISIDLLTLFKIVEKRDPIQIVNNSAIQADKTFFIIDYDNISSSSQLSDIFIGLKDHPNCFFLLKSNNVKLSDILAKNYRLFFEFDEIFDFISLYDSKHILYITDNIATSIFQRYKITNYTSISTKSEKTILLSGLVF